MNGAENSLVDDELMDSQDNSNSGSNEQVTESGSSIEYAEQWLEFRCVFCTQDLRSVSNPKLLPCLHTGCESCLSSESNNGSPTSSASGRGSKQISCPECSQEVIMGETVDHLFLNEYMQSTENLPEESSYPCSCEEGAEGVAFCVECQEWLCDTCVNAHHRVRVTKDHTVRSKEDMDGENLSGRNQKYLFCPNHSQEQLKLYCETCDKLTCRDCQLSDHKEHKYQFLTKACEEEKGVITELLERIKEKQVHIETACNNLDKRNEEIVEREKRVNQEVKTFAVKFITEINKRSKVLLGELDKICAEKKNQLKTQSEELRSVMERLKHSQKFAETAINLGSETALVYSKKPITSQLRRILKHPCKFQNPNQVVDIQLKYETSFLIQYITSLGQILVDQQPIPGASGNQNMMLPMPQTVTHKAPIPTNPTYRPQMQPVIQRLSTPMQQQVNQQHPMLFNASQVTSSTDLARNPAPQVRQAMNKRMVAYQPRTNLQQSPQTNFNIQQATSTYSPRQQPMQQPVQQLRQVQQAPQLMRQVQQPQQIQPAPPQQQSQPPPNYNNAVQLPMPLRQNKSISVTPVQSSPSPSKQRSNITMNAVNNQGVRANNTQVQMQRQPQVIVLDEPHKTPTMSNTNRLSHFPNIAATLSSHPSLQIQPTNNYNSGKY